MRKLISYSSRVIFRSMPIGTYTTESSIIARWVSSTVE